MRLETGAVYGVVALVLGLTVVSGPLVGAVDFTPDREFVSLGEGSLTVDRVSVPSSASLDPAYQSDTYRLEVPDARLNVTSISGHPIVEYRVEIDALGHSRSTTHFPGEGAEGWLPLTMTTSTFPSSHIDEARYNATLSVFVRTNGTERVLHREPVPVEVTDG